MPGFGSGPFGQTPFGEWAWSQNVLFETVPEVYKDAQTAEGDFLRKYTQGQQPSFDNIRHHIENYGSIRDPLEVRSASSEVEFLVLGKQVYPTGATEQAGVLGKVLSLGTFTAGDRTAIFRPSDVGKQLFIRRSNIAANNQQIFQITNIISSKQVFTEPPITPDAGPMRWEIRAQDALPEGQVQVEVRGGDPSRVKLGWSVKDGRGSYEVVSRQMFYQPVTSNKLLTEREGSDGYIRRSVAWLNLGVYLSLLRSTLRIRQGASATSPFSGSVIPLDGEYGDFVGLQFQSSPGAGTGTLTSVFGGFLYVFTYESGVTTNQDFENAVAAFPDCAFEVYTPADNPSTTLPVGYSGEFCQFSGGGLPELATDGSYAFQPQDIGKQVSINGSSVEGNNGVWEITSVIDGNAIIGVLEVPGKSNDPSGKVLYAYQEGADRLVTVAHIADGTPSLTTSVSYSEALPDRLDVTVRLGTDSEGGINSDLSSIRDAIFADPVLSNYIAVYQPPGRIRPPESAGAFSRAAIKPGYLADTNQRFYWALRPFARIVLQGGLPLGTLETDGMNLEIPPETAQDPAERAQRRTLVRSFSAPFKTGDVGKLLTIRGSVYGNDGTYTIYSVPAAGAGTEALVSALLTVNVSTAAETGLYYGIRSDPQFVPDPTRLNPQATEVQASAESLLNILAYDFGLVVDNQQVDVRQRGWVKQVSQWTAVKGTPESIENIATLSGFVAQVESLNSIPAHPLMGSATTPVAFPLYFVPDAGRYYTGCSLTTAAGFYYIDAPAGTFLPADEGKVAKINFSTAVPANSNHYVVAEYVSPIQVRILSPSVGDGLDAGNNITLPEPNNGNLALTMGQLYSGVLPEFPRMDDINFDLTATMYDDAGYPRDDRPGLDQPCDVQPIKVGYDFDGYAKAELDCGTIAGTSGLLDTVLEAYTAGAGGDDIRLTSQSGAQHRAYVTGDIVTLNYISGSTTTLQVEQMLSQVPITSVVASGAQIQVFTGFSPHGLITGDTVRIEGVTGTVEANNEWVVTRVNDYDIVLNGSFFVHTYTGGGTVTNLAVAQKVSVKTPGTAANILVAPGSNFSLAAFTGGVGLTPPQVVSLTPAVGLQILSVAVAGSTRTVTVQGEDLSAVLGGEWRFVDQDGVEFYIDTAPTLIIGSPLWIWEVTTIAAVSPALGPTYFEYLCPLTISCDYCPSYKVLVTLTADQVVGEGDLAQENAFERAIERIEDVLPAHTEATYHCVVNFSTPPLFTVVTGEAVVTP